MFFQLEGPLGKKVHEKKVRDVRIDPELNI